MQPLFVSERASVGKTKDKMAKFLNLRCSAASSHSRHKKGSRKELNIFPVLRVGKMDSFPHPAIVNLNQQTLDFKRIF